MFGEQLRAAVMASPRTGLAGLSSTLWKGHAAGAIDDVEAQGLAELIETRKAVPGKVSQPRRVGSRPRSPASTERRRRWVASGWLPPQLAGQFTQGEAAVLAVIAREISKTGRCRLYVGQLAAFAGVSRSTVKSATRQAQRLGLIAIEVWKVTAIRNLANTITITSPAWSTWLRMRSRTETVKSPSTTPRNLDSSGQSICKPDGRRLIGKKQRGLWPSSGLKQTEEPGSP